jgi:hypothetical protein
MDFESARVKSMQIVKFFTLSILRNRRNRLALIILFIMLAVTIGAATIFKRGGEGTILYTVDMNADQPQEILVTLSFQEPVNSFFNEPLKLWGLVEMDLRDVTLIDDRGQSIPYKRQRLGDIEKVEAEGLNVRHCKYTVKVGKEFADVQQGKYSGRHLGRKTDDYVVLSGANIFLIPENLSNYRVVVSFTNVKPQWQIATTLEFNDATFQLNSDLGSETTPDKLLQSVIGLGEFDLQEFSVGENHIRLYFENHCEDDPENFKDKLAEGLLLVEQNLWPANTTYSILVIPRQERENELFIISGMLGDAIDSSGVISPFQWGRLFENLASIRTKYQPYGIRLEQEEDRWFIDGATRYIALKMLEAARISNYKDSIQRTYDDYLYNARAWVGNLRKISLDMETRATKSTLVLELFDRELKAKQRGDLFAFLRGIHKNGGVFDIAGLADAKTNERTSKPPPIV